MNPKQIKAELRERNLTQGEVAKKLGVSQVAVSYIINRKSTSRAVMQGIADLIEMPIRKVFPDYFGIESQDQGQRAA